MKAMSAVKKTVKRVIPATITVAGVTVAVSIIPVDSPQSGARAWAKALAPDDRSNYARPDQVRELPIEYRHALFATMATGEERAEFWRQVFRQYRRTHQLTGAQEQVLSQTEARLLKPEVFAELPISREHGKELLAAREAVTASLGADAAKELFVTAGAERRSGTALPLLERLRHAWRTTRPTALVALVDQIATPVYAWSCNCKQTSDCSYEQVCGGWACDATGWGCGSWWTESCTSICGYAS